MSRKSTLHIEARLNATAEMSRVYELKENIVNWLREDCEYVKLGHAITGFSSVKNASMIETIHASECLPVSEAEDAYLALKEMHVTIHCFRLEHESDDELELPSSDANEDEGMRILNLQRLPSLSLSTVWDSLYFDDSLRSRLLNQICQMMHLFSDGTLDPTLHNWNRVILLHGPPGSGKTSLCRALAQKLAIRSGNDYISAYLAEINANALHSKFFGESGKSIAKAFNDIYAIAQHSATLVCVLIDEVETIAGCRAHAHASHEVGDAIRATNQLLTVLDKLRFYPNVIVFCTSNLMSMIDEAFLSRVDIAEHIVMPSTGATYEILRSSMNDLILQGKVVIGDGVQDKVEEKEGSEKSFVFLDSFDEEDEKPLQAACFPRYGLAEGKATNDPDGFVGRLLRIAEACRGKSGRLLRRLPSLAIAKYTYYHPRQLDETLDALLKVIEEQKDLTATS